MITTKLKDINLTKTNHKLKKYGLVVKAPLGVITYCLIILKLRDISTKPILFLDDVKILTKIVNDHNTGLSNPVYYKQQSKELDEVPY